MEKILRTIEQHIPRRLYTFFQPAYHFTWALLGALIYRFPSRKLVVIGVTGTKGKSSTVEIINRIFEEAGYKTAMTGTIRFKIGDTSRPNMYKMSMPGRMFMQKFLREAVDTGCTHAIIETTSEGSRFFRQLFIHLDALVFLNLSPEHIESHGSYENYVQAKVDIAKQLPHGSWRTLWDLFGLVHKKTVLVGNKDDIETQKFFAVGADVNVGYSLADAVPYELIPPHNTISFTYKGQKVTSPLRGLFNIYNTLAAVTVSEHFGVNPKIAAKALAQFNDIKGRVQSITISENSANNMNGENGASTTIQQNFEVIVDYAHTADSLEKLYQTFPNQYKICVLGSTGGGRDVWKRPEMGKVADTYCDHIILTNEDPYDEDPQKIIADVKAGITHKPCDIILDRREAIARAISLAHTLVHTDVNNPANNVVLITGKGTDPYIMTANNTKIPWSDAKVVEEELIKILRG